MVRCTPQRRQVLEARLQENEQHQAASMGAHDRRPRGGPGAPLSCGAAELVLTALTPCTVFDEPIEHVLDMAWPTVERLFIREGATPSPHHHGHPKIKEL